MSDHLLCHGCIDDPVLSAEVLASGTAGRCYHCERKRKAWPLSRLAERIHGVLQANYSPTYPGPHDYAGWEMSGDDVADTITELAGLDDSDIGRDIQAILSDRYGYAARYSGDIDPYGGDVSYVFAPADTSEHSLSWTAFCDLLKTQSRFFNSAAREMLADCAHILKVIAGALIARRSGYAAVLQTLLTIAGEQPVDATKVAPAKERADSIDREWREEPAFAGAPFPSVPTGGKPETGERHVVE